MIHSMYFEFYEAFLSEVLWLTNLLFLFFLYSEFFPRYTYWTVFFMSGCPYVVCTICHCRYQSVNFNSTTRFRWIFCG